MKAFITGITGFAGSHLVEHLLDCGDEVIGSGLEPSWQAAHAGRSMQSVELLDWNLRGELSTAAKAALEAFRPDCIYHLAAVSIPQHCGQDTPTELARQVNVGGTQRVLDLAADLAIRPRVLVVSSSYVYGSGDRSGPRVSEDSPLAPRGGYGATKLAAEQVAVDAAAGGTLDCVIARAFNHTGPRQSAEMMLPEWAQQFAASDHDSIKVHTLDAWLDLTDVRDVVRAYRLLIQRGARGGIYNIGSGIMRRSGDVFRRLQELAGDRRSVHETRPGERHQPIADCRRMHRATGWRPQIPLWQTIEETLEYWKAKASA